MTVSIDIKGLDKAVAKLVKAGKLKELGGALKAAGLHVQGKINVYPAATEANSPGNPTGKWYERGFGSKWQRKDGSIGGRKTSETLGRKWTVDQPDSFSVVIGNNVSYGPWVQDPEKQTSFHAEHGWKTTAQVAKEETHAVMDFIRKEIRKVLGD